MSLPRTPPPALLLVAAFSRHTDLLALARRRLEGTHGPVALASPEYAFDHTRYYEPTMGPGLRKQPAASARLIDPADLPPIKHHTHALELALAADAHLLPSPPEAEGEGLEVRGAGHLDPSPPHPQPLPPTEARGDTAPARFAEP